MYVTPELIEIGSFEEVTLDKGSDTADQGGHRW